MFGRFVQGDIRCSSCSHGCSSSSSCLDRLFQSGGTISSNGWSTSRRSKEKASPKSSFGWFFSSFRFLRWTLFHRWSFLILTGGFFWAIRLSVIRRRRRFLIRWRWRAIRIFETESDWLLAQFFPCLSAIVCACLQIKTKEKKKFSFLSSSKNISVDDVRE